MDVLRRIVSTLGYADCTASCDHALLLLNTQLLIINITLFRAHSQAPLTKLAFAG